MTIQRISGGSKFEDIIGYSRVVVDQGLVTVSGTAGFNYADGSIAEDVATQTHQAFQNLRNIWVKRIARWPMWFARRSSLSMLRIGRWSFQ